MVLAATKLITISCVLLHAIVGCGWHHVHADACAHNDLAVQGCSHGHDHGESGHHRGDSRAEDAPAVPSGEMLAECDHGGGPQCVHERCTYIRDASPVVEDDCSLPAQVLPDAAAAAPRLSPDVAARLHIKPPPRASAVKLALLQLLVV